MSMHLKRIAAILKPDQSRVLLRPFSPGGPERVARIIGRIILTSTAAEFDNARVQQL